MSKTIELTDEQYQIIQHAAEQRGQTADTLLGEWIEELRDPYTNPRYFTEDEFLRHLGMTDEMIRQAEDIAARDEGAEDADV
jgi:hypothetical protein